MLLSAAALAFTATPAFAAVTPNPTLTGTTVSTIPAITLTSNLVAAASDDDRLDDHRPPAMGSRSMSPGRRPSRCRPRSPGIDRLYTLSAAERRWGWPAIATFTVDRTAAARADGDVRPAGDHRRPSPSRSCRPLALGDVVALGVFDGITQIAPTTPPVRRSRSRRPRWRQATILSFRVSCSIASLTRARSARRTSSTLTRRRPACPCWSPCPRCSPQPPPTFAWQGTELGGSFERDITDASGKTLFAPGSVRTTTDTRLSTLSLPLVSDVTYSSRSGFGRSTPSATAGLSDLRFTLVPPLVPPPPTRLAKVHEPEDGERRNWPAAAPVVAPDIRGHHHLQREGLPGGREIPSVFPRRNRYRVPKGKPGAECNTSGSSSRTSGRGRRTWRSRWRAISPRNHKTSRCDVRTAHTVQRRR